MYLALLEPHFSPTLLPSQAKLHGVRRLCSFVCGFAFLFLSTETGAAQQFPTNEVVCQFDFTRPNSESVWTSGDSKFFSESGLNTAFGIDLRVGRLSLSTNTFKSLKGRFSAHFVAAIRCTENHQIVSRRLSEDTIDSVNARHHTNTRDTQPLIAVYVIREGEMVFLKQTKIQYIQFVITCSKRKGIADVYANGRSLTKIFADPISGLLYPALDPSYTVSLDKFIEFGAEEAAFPGTLVSLTVFDGLLTEAQIYDLCSPTSSLSSAVLIEGQRDYDPPRLNMYHEVEWYSWPYARVQTGWPTMGGREAGWDSLVWKAVSGLFMGEVAPKRRLVSYPDPGPVQFFRGLVLYPNPITEDAL